MTDQRVAIYILGAAVILGVAAGFALEWTGKHNAATFVGLATTAIGILCPSPLFHKGADDGGKDKSDS